jgi:hypothetical protein
LAKAFQTQAAELKVSGFHEVVSLCSVDGSAGMRQGTEFSGGREEIEFFLVLFID